MLQIQTYTASKKMSVKTSIILNGHIYLTQNTHIYLTQNTDLHNVATIYWLESQVHMTLILVKIFSNQMSDAISKCQFFMSDKYVQRHFRS